MTASECGEQRRGGRRHACEVWPAAFAALTCPVRPRCRNLGCSNFQCNLCKLSQRRRCPTNFAAKYLAPCDVVEAKCGAQIYVVVTDIGTGQLVQQGLEDLGLLVSRERVQRGLGTAPGRWRAAPLAPALLPGCGGWRGSLLLGEPASPATLPVLHTQ